MISVNFIFLHSQSLHWYFWCSLNEVMEQGGHINIAMVEDISTNGTAGSKTDASVDWNREPHGSTVSFHNIQYKVHQKSGFLCTKSSSTREILVDLKWVLKVFAVFISFLLSLFFSCHCDLHVSLQVIISCPFLITHTLKYVHIQ